MTAWVVVCVLSLCIVPRYFVRARRRAAQPLFVSWVSFDASSSQDVTATADEALDQQFGLTWTNLDDHQLERLLSESSS